MIQHTGLVCHAGLQMQEFLSDRERAPIQSACGYLLVRREFGVIAMRQPSGANNTGSTHA